MILVDRSRHVEGLARCQTAKWWRYFEQGYGIVPASQALPLATGSAVHEALAGMLRHAREFGEIPNRLTVRSLTGNAVDAYKKLCSARGFHDEDSALLAYQIAEQSRLIEGLCWAFYRERLPWLLAEFEILHVEEETQVILGCSCGLGDTGTREDHQNRACHGCGQCDYTASIYHCGGVLLMLRPDFITRRRSDGAIGAHDFKTSGYGLVVKEHEHWVQMALSSMAAEKLTGEPCTHTFLHGLLKGKRDFFTKAEREGGGQKKQNSILCYAWHRAAAPPFATEEWSYTYTAKKDFGRVPLWEISSTASTEAWVMETLPSEIVKAQLDLVGPSQRLQWMEPQLLREIEDEARYWAQVESREQVRSSYDCYPFGRACAYIDCCFGPPGADLLGSGKFVRRMPHHAAEAEVAAAAGWVGDAGEGEETE